MSQNSATTNDPAGSAPGQPAGESREQRLVRINAKLAEMNLKPLPSLGGGDGETELLDIIDVYTHSKRFFTDVKFGARFPNGASGEFTPRWNANSLVSDGAVIIAVIDDKFAIVKQWRPTLGRWTYEVPRGFGEKIDKAKVSGALGTIRLGDLPLANLTREFGEEVMKDAEVVDIAHLGNLAENSGTHTTTPSFYLVSIRTEGGKLGGRVQGTEEHLKVQLWDRAKVESEMGRKINDLHSIGALDLALRYIDRLKKLSSP